MPVWFAILTFHQTLVAYAMRPNPLFLSTIALIAAFGVGADAWAQQGRGRDRGDRPQQNEQRGQEERGDDSLSDSVRRIVRDTRGQVLSAERVPFDGREMHRVKVLDTRGRVRVYMDDPRVRGDDRQPRGRRQAPTRNDDD